MYKIIFNKYTSVETTKKKKRNNNIQIKSVKIIYKFYKQ